jgi:hypothetical protein
MGAAPVTTITPVYITLRTLAPRQVEMLIGVSDQKVAVIGPITKTMLERLAAEAATGVWNWNKWGD